MLALAFVVGSTAIPSAAVSLLRIDFVKGQLHVPHWEGVLILTVALMVVSSVSAALFLACLKLGGFAPRILISSCCGLLATAFACAVFFLTGNLLFFFLIHFGSAIFIGLLLGSQNRGLT